MNLANGWTVLAAFFDLEGMIPVIDREGRHFSVDRRHIGAALDAGRQVKSMSGWPMTMTDVNAGRLL